MNIIRKILRKVYFRKNQISAGCVIYKKNNNGFLYLIIRRGGRYNDWIFPRGKVEKNETALIAAKREVFEETNLKVKIVNKLPSIKYTFYLDQYFTHISKTVIYFLAKALTNDVKFTNNTDNHIEHIEGHKWIRAKEGKKYLNSQNKYVLNIADLILRKEKII